MSDLYFSADIEADGPIPGTYSMLSFGLAVAGRFDGTLFEAYDPTKATFYRELKPLPTRSIHKRSQSRGSSGTNWCVQEQSRPTQCGQPRNGC
jgi:hypothetical protein